MNLALRPRTFHCPDKAITFQNPKSFRNAVRDDGKTVKETKQFAFLDEISPTMQFIKQSQWRQVSTYGVAYPFRMEN